MTWEYTKQFWITEIKKQQGIHGFQDSDFSVLNWWTEYLNATTYQELDELARKLRKEVVSKSYIGFENLLASEERELNKCVVKDVSELEKELNILKTTERKAFESGIETYKEDIKAFENKLKAIIGNDLNDWESKIVKAGSSDKDIVDLQKKISKLATEKDNLQAEIKKKQDQILNHKCDTPNNAELNQIKEELKKMTQEKDKKTELYEMPLLAKEKEQNKLEFCVSRKNNEKAWVVDFVSDRPSGLSSPKSKQEGHIWISEKDLDRGERKENNHNHAESITFYVLEQNKHLFIDLIEGHKESMIKIKAFGIKIFSFIDSCQYCSEEMHNFLKKIRNSLHQLVKERSLSSGYQSQKNVPFYVFFYSWRPYNLTEYTIVNSSNQQKNTCKILW